MTSQVLTGQLSPTTRSSVLPRVFATHPDIAMAVARVLLAVVMFPHGAQKLLGWWGGYGWDGSLGFLTGQVGLPKPLAAGLILLEFFGPILLLAGLLTRPVALGFIGIMLGAIFSVHAQFGFFMNWSGAQAGEGFEYHLLVIALSIVLLFRGGGSLSLDRRIAR